VLEPFLQPGLELLPEAPEYLGLSVTTMLSSLLNLPFLGTA
jgi:hypothetical protein